MKLKYEYHQMPVEENQPDIYIAGDGDSDSELVEVAFVASNISAKGYLSFESLRRLRELITDVLQQHETEDTQCPACGYTREQAVAIGDHKTCRRYPFFECERQELPESDAV